MEGGKCSSAQHKIECLPVWIPLCTCVMGFNKADKEEGCGEAGEQKCKIFALDCNLIFYSLPSPHAGVVTHSLVNHWAVLAPLTLTWALD